MSHTLERLRYFAALCRTAVLTVCLCDTCTICGAGPGSQAAPSQSGWDSDEEVKPSNGSLFDVSDLLAGFSPSSGGAQRSEGSVAGSERSAATGQLLPVDDLLGGPIQSKSPTQVRLLRGRPRIVVT